jgi:hypothetical protein
MSVILLVLLLAQFAPTATGELRLIVTDAAGLPLTSAVELVSESNQVREQLQTEADGTVVARRLPFGTYRVAVAREGFAAYAGLIEVRSSLPTEYRVTLSLAPLQAEVTVTPEETLINPQQPTAVQRIGAVALQQRTTALPGRGLPDLVNTQPGWLLEANGVLHPRGSEYDIQYVVDGLPLTDNRSPAFAPAVEAAEAHSISILTAGYPAEYGRKLGGIIEVVTGGETRRGFHGDAAASVGSFATRDADASAGLATPGMILSVSGALGATDRYLDPPVEDNYSNHGTTSNIASHFERDLTAADRLGVIVRYGRTRFLVPNELVQQEAGQLQRRNSSETAAQFSHQRVLSARALTDIRGLVRTISAGLDSNEFSTPIAARQDRGLREAYVKGAVAWHQGVHEWKAGGEAAFGSVREAFSYSITDPDDFDPDVPQSFTFADRRAAREQALFVQDRISAGPWTVNAGVRWDHYRLIVDRHGVSPRLGVAWSLPQRGLVVRGAYDRAFQTPAVENLLLGSSDALESLSEEVVRLPVEPSRGHFYEAGISKALLGSFRAEATYFQRRIAHFADDDVLLNTGVGFPVAFHHANIRGTELKIDLPRWRRLSGFASYAYLRGIGALPITGGLFLGEGSAQVLESAEEFPISQDQRHTLRGRASYQLSPAAWVALAAGYGSGLPVEFEDDDLEDAVEQYGRRIVDRVDLEAGRVRPSFSIDASVGVQLRRSAAGRIEIQADVRNLTNRLNVINFAGLFSGTALGPPRSVAVRVRVGF